MPNSIAVAAPKFGERLRLRRIKIGKTHGEAAQDVRHRVRETGLRVSPSQIVAIEQGRIPSWPLLLGICRVYGLDLRETVLALLDSLEFPGAVDLLRHDDRGFSAAAQSQPQQGAVDVTASEDSSRRLALAKELDDLAETLSGAIQDVARRLARDVAS